MTLQAPICKVFLCFFVCRDYNLESFVGKCKGRKAFNYYAAFKARENQRFSANFPANLKIDVLFRLIGQIWQIS